MQDDEVYKRKEQTLYKTITISLHQDNLGGYVWCFEEQAWRATLSVFFLLGSDADKLCLYNEI